MILKMLIFVVASSNCFFSTERDDKTKRITHRDKREDKKRRPSDDTFYYNEINDFDCFVISIVLFLLGSGGRGEERGGLAGA